MTTSPPRWVRAATGRAHLDLGERAAKSLRVLSEHVIVTACRAHVDAKAEPVPDTHQPLCSNCQRIARVHATRHATEIFSGHRRVAPTALGDPLAGKRSVEHPLY